MALLNLSRYEETDCICANCFYYSGGYCSLNSSPIEITENENCGNFSLYEIFYDDEYSADIKRS